MESKARKYRVKNVSKGLVYIKELRKSLSPEKEMEFEAVVFDGTRRLKDQGLIELDDIGPSNAKPRFQEAELLLQASEARRKRVTALAREKLAENPNPKKAPKVEVAAVKFDDPIEKVPTAEDEPASVEEDKPAEPAAESNPFDMTSSEEPPKKKRGRPKKNS